MQTLLNTLYVMTPHAYAHLENATVRIDVEREKRLQVPLHHLSSIVCFGNIMVSPALMHRLAEEGKSLVLLDERGRKTVVVAYQERKQEELQHPLLDTKTSIGLLPLLQARTRPRNASSNFCCPSTPRTT